MIIRTQSGEALAEVVHIYTADMVGEKNCYVFGVCAGHGVFSGAKLTLGLYPDKKSAIEEIDKISKFFESNPNGVYKMN